MALIIESKIQKGEKIDLDHMKAFRMSKEEIIYNWLRYLAQIAQNHFITIGKPDPKERLFQTPFPDQIWVNIEVHAQRKRKDMPFAGMYNSY